MRRAVGLLASANVRRILASKRCFAEEISEHQHEVFLFFIANATLEEDGRPRWWLCSAAAQPRATIAGHCLC